MRVLLTGGAGFIGHHIVESLLKDANAEVTVVDRLDSSGNLNRLAEIGAINNPRFRFFYHDLRAPLSQHIRKQLGEFEYILHLAAGTHVDRSIETPLEFVYDNVVATCNILDFARERGCDRFLYFSTDEVFGPAPPGVAFREDDRYRSGNPYAATKAAGEELAVAYHNTYGLPVLVTHTMNVIGRRQHPEKFVPNTMGKILRGDTVRIYADPTLTRTGSRYYIDASDVVDAVARVLSTGSPGEKYNIAGAREIGNLELAQQLAVLVGKELKYELVDSCTGRPGHDLRYALDGSKLANEGWRPAPIERRLEELVNWTLENRQWL